MGTFQTSSLHLTRPSDPNHLWSKSPSNSKIAADVAACDWRVAVQNVMQDVCCSLLGFVGDNVLVPE